MPRPPAAAAIRAATSFLHAGRSGVVLAYHDILPDSADVYQYAVTESTFLHQLDIVAGLGLRPVTLSEFTDHLLAGDASGLAAVVFDDALVGVHRYAMPHLGDRGIPWTLLPVTDHPGVRPRWWSEAARTMSRAEIGEALEAGATLCGHTANHVSLPDVAPRVALDELTRSRNTLSEWAGSEVRELCYPFGHQNSDVRALAARAGYRVGYSFTNGRSHPRTDPFAQPRMAMHEGLRTKAWLTTLLRPHLTWPKVRDLRDHAREAGR